MARVSAPQWSQRRQVAEPEDAQSGVAASHALRMAATTLRTSKSYLGAQFRQLQSRRLGPPETITAMAAKLARLECRMLTNRPAGAASPTSMGLWRSVWPRGQNAGA